MENMNMPGSPIQHTSIAGVAKMVEVEQYHLSVVRHHVTAKQYKRVTRRSRGQTQQIDVQKNKWEDATNESRGKIHRKRIASESTGTYTRPHYNRAHTSARQIQVLTAIPFPNN